MTEPKPNQGMQRPSLGGIGSRMDVGRSRQTCSHPPEDFWRLKGSKGKWICGVCHPAAFPRSASNGSALRTAREAAPAKCAGGYVEIAPYRRDEPASPWPFLLALASGLVFVFLLGLALVWWAVSSGA